MALEENLRYLLTADASGMTRELTRAQKSLKETGTAADKAAAQQEKAAKESSAAWQKTGTSLSTVGKSIAAGFATFAVGSFVKDSINEAREAAQVQRETAQVIKTTGGAANVTAKQMGDLADKLSKITAVDDEVIQAGGNVLATFTKVRNETGKSNDVFNRGLAVAQDLAAKMRTDLQPAVLQVGKALNDPIKGLTSLGRAGIQFTEDQKKTIKRLVETGDVLGAQNMILAELEKQVGGTAAAMADPFARFQMSVDNAKEAVGTALMPTMEDLAKKAQGLSEWFQNLDTSTQKWILGFAGVTLALPAIVSVGSAVKTVAGAAKAGAERLVEMFRTSASSATTLNTEVDKTSKLMTGLKVAGVITSIGLAFDFMAQRASRSRETIDREFGNPQTIEDYRNEVARLQKQVTEFKPGFSVNLGITKVFRTNELADLNDENEKAKDKLAATIKTLGEMSATTRDVGKEFGLTRDQVEALANKFGIDLAGNTDQVTASFRDALGVNKDLGGAQGDLAGTVNDTAAAMANQKIAADDLKTTYDNLLTPFLNKQEALLGFDIQLGKLHDSLKVLSDGAPDTTEQLQAVQQATIDMGKNFESTAMTLNDGSAESATAIEALRTRTIAALQEVIDKSIGPTHDQAVALRDQLIALGEVKAVPTVDVNDQASDKIHNIEVSLNNLFQKVGGAPSFDFIARALGIGGKGLFNAAGGVIGDVYQAGTGGGKTGGITAVVGEGNGPEYVIPTEPKYRTRAINLMTKASRELGIYGLAAGGVLAPAVSAWGAEGGRRAEAIAAAILEAAKRYGGKGRIAAEFARAQVGKPYVWGASGPNAYDCSGLTMASWAHAGVGIPRTSHAQIAAARAMAYGDAVNTAGSLFFTTSAASPSGGHIAISHGDGTLSNARGTATGVVVTGPFGGRQGIPNFDRGGVLMPGLNTIYNGTGRPEQLSPGATVQVTINNYGPVGVDDLVETVHRGLLNKQRRVATLGLS